MSLAVVRSRAPSLVLLVGLAIVLTLFGTALFESKYDLGEITFFGLALCYFLVLGQLTHCLQTEVDLDPRRVLERLVVETMQPVAMSMWSPRAEQR